MNEQLLYILSIIIGIFIIHLILLIASIIFSYLQHEHAKRQLQVQSQQFNAMFQVFQAHMVEVKQVKLQCIMEEFKRRSHQVVALVAEEREERLRVLMEAILRERL